MKDHTTHIQIKIHAIKTIDGFDMINYNLINKNFSENFKNKKNFKKINTGDLVKDSLIEYIQQTKNP